ncbi:hypothetical protein GCM10027159_25750 [Lysobacter terrae]
MVSSLNRPGFLGTEIPDNLRPALYLSHPDARSVLSFVEDIDVIEDIGLCQLPRRADLSPDPFALGQLEEALGYGVAMAVGVAGSFFNRIAIGTLRLAPRLRGMLGNQSCI